MPVRDIVGIYVFIDNMDEQRTLRQLVVSDVNYNCLYIDYPTADAPFELKSDLIYLLSKFNGFAGEDPYKNLKEF